MNAAMPARPERANANLLRVIRYFASMTGGKPMPHYSCFRPNDLHWLFGHFYTVKVLDGGTDYRIGFCGPFWALMYGSDMTGCRLSELEACGRMRALRPVYNAVVAARHPSYCVGRMTWRGGQSIDHERVTIPFADDDGNPALLLVAAQCNRELSEVLQAKGCGEPILELGEACHPDELQSSSHNSNSSLRSA